MKNWNEQIRPTTGAEIVGNSEFVEAFNEWAATDNYPSALLLVGPAGTGKSSAANAIIHTMLGKWNNDMNVMWTNASDDRGIDHIRKEVKQFSRLSGVGISRKIVVLDEADNRPITGLAKGYYGEVCKPSAIHTDSQPPRKNQSTTQESLYDFHIQQGFIPRRCKASHAFDRTLSCAC